MNSEHSEQPPAGIGELCDPDEVATLIAHLHATLARLDEITAGEVDSISDGSGSSFLLQRAQSALRLNESARNAAILDTLPWHVALIDSNATITSVNAAWNAYAQDNSAQCGGLGEGSNYLRICDAALGTDSGADDARVAGAGIRSVLGGSAQEFTFEYPCHSPTTERWFQMTVSPVISATSIGAVIMHLDVSARRKAAQELRESELRFRQMAESIREVFFLGEPDGSRMWYVSPAYEEIWGRSLDSLYADPTTWITSIHIDDRARTIRETFIQRDGAFQVEYRIVRPDNSIRWIRANGYPVLDANGTLVRIAGVARDITEQKLASELLFESQQRLELATGSARIGIWDLDLIAGKLYWDAQMYAHYGIKAQQFSGTFDGWRAGLHPEDRERAEAEFAQAIAGHTGFHTEFRVLWPSGEVRFIEAHAQVRYRADAAPTRIVGINFDITERRRAERQLHESERRYSEMLSNVELFAVMLDLQGRITFCNDYLLRITGWQREEVIGRNWFDMFIPTHDHKIRKAFAELLANVPESWQRENQIVTRTGALRSVHWNNSLLRSEDGAINGTASLGGDVTDARMAESRVRYLNRVHAILSSINTLIVRARDRDELFAEACRIAVETGGFRMAMIGSLDPLTGNIESVASSGKDSELLNEVGEILTTKARAAASMVGTAIAEKRILVANDSRHDPRVLLGARYAEAGVCSLAVLPLIVLDQAVGVFVLYASEVEFFHQEEVKLLAELAGDIAFAIDHIDKSRRLDFLAFYDSLTGLPSVNLFKDHLEKFIQGARQNDGEVCVLAIDIERFAHANDNFGRGAGDELLRAIAARLQQFLVEPYALGRIGADAFAVASPGDPGSISIKLSECIHKSLSEPFSIASQQLTVSVQAGIAVFPTDGDDSESLFKNAEAALRSGKRSGARDTYFSHKLNARIAQRYAAEKELRDAIAANEFIIHYQPRVDMTSGKLVGAEALIRWQHPQRGVVAPVEFIALAEETGLIVTIGAWVLETVCAQLSAWVRGGVPVVPVAVNLSSVQFEFGDLVDTVTRALTAHGLAARLLVLELTESAVMNDPPAAAIALHALRKIGVGLALDDFGTGYSSLAHLKRFPFDSVKIDRSFITDITSNPEDAAIASAIIAMAHGLKLKVVAEGVETQGQFNYLRARACDEMQGYLFGAAVPNEEFESQLRSSRRLSLPEPQPADLLTLLIVDDEAGIRASLARMLRSDGYRILQADSGQAGLDVLAVNDVQVIISDQRMIGMTGTEFLSAASQLYPDTVRMILSGFTDLKVVTDAVNRGSVFKFLTKPWDDDVLREQVRDAFRRHKAK
jgi:diguanylate cyclase (GGDEF)-like protein/PAS domain S-box-containing protein